MDLGLKSETEFIVCDSYYTVNIYISLIAVKAVWKNTMVKNCFIDSQNTWQRQLKCKMDCARIRDIKFVCFLNSEFWLLTFELNLNFIYAAAANKLCLLNPGPWPFDHLHCSSEPTIPVGQSSVCSCVPLQPSANIFLAQTRRVLGRWRWHKFDHIWMLKLYPQHCLKVHCWTTDLKSKK